MKIHVYLLLWPFRAGLNQFGNRHHWAALICRYLCKMVIKYFTDTSFDILDVAMHYIDYQIIPWNMFSVLYEYCFSCDWTWIGDDGLTLITI